MTAPRPRGRPKAFEDKTDQNTVRSLDRAMSILEALSQTNGITLSDLAERTDQSTATVYRVLTTLAGHGIAEADGQLWHVGVGAFRIGTAFLRRTNLAEQSRAPMQALMRDTGETANLGVMMGDDVLFVSQVETQEAIRAFFPPGTKSPMHVSGIGKALLAFGPEERVEALAAKGLAGFTPASITRVEDLRADLALTRARGFSIDNEERTEGMRCVAAPVFDALGAAVAGISVSGPAFRMSLEDADAIGARVCAAADAVTRGLGGVPAARA